MKQYKGKKDIDEFLQYLTVEQVSRLGQKNQTQPTKGVPCTQLFRHDITDEDEDEFFMCPDEAKFN